MTLVVRLASSSVLRIVNTQIGARNGADRFSFSQDGRRRTDHIEARAELQSRPWSSAVVAIEEPVSRRGSRKSFVYESGAQQAGVCLMGHDRRQPAASNVVVHSTQRMHRQPSCFLFSPHLRDRGANTRRRWSPFSVIVLPEVCAA